MRMFLKGFQLAFLIIVSSSEAEKALVSKQPNQATFQAAAEAAILGAKPQKYNAFKVELAKRTIVKALFTVGGMA